MYTFVLLPQLYFDYLEKAYEAFIYGQDLDNLDEYTEALYEELSEWSCHCINSCNLW